jgi:hypothetical protein
MAGAWRSYLTVRITAHEHHSLIYNYFIQWKSKAPYTVIKSPLYVFFLLKALRCDAMRCDAMRKALRCDAMRCEKLCDAMRCEKLCGSMRCQSFAVRCDAILIMSVLCLFASQTPSSPRPPPVGPP